jgi:methyl acetate hydrolase
MIDHRRLDDMLAGAVDGGAAPGVVALVADRGTLLYEGAFGRRDVRVADAVGLDTVFRIASMTKLVTAISVLAQVEAGRIELDTPVGDVLPAFDELAVLTGFDGEVPLLRPPARRATLRHLLTHTSGLAYDTWNPDITRFHAVSGVPRLQTGSRGSFAVPLVADPGSQFNYGTSMDWVGLLVEALTGVPLERYWREQLFEPMGLGDTVVELRAEQRERTAPVHAPGAGGGWVATEIDFVQQPEVYAGGHCLYSTPRDFLAFQQLMLEDGSHNGRRFLAPATVELAFQNHIGELNVGTIATADPAQSDDVALGGKKWGLGILVDPADVPGGRSAGSGGWMGGFNTFFWVDRPRGITASLYAQTVPFYAPAIVELYQAFEREVYAALDGYASATD